MTKLTIITIITIITFFLARDLLTAGAKQIDNHNSETKINISKILE